MKEIIKKFKPTLMIEIHSTLLGKDKTVERPVGGGNKEHERSQIILGGVGKTKNFRIIV